MCLWITWHCKLVHSYNYVVDKTYAETAAVLRSTSHVTTKQRCNIRCLFHNVLCKETNTNPDTNVYMVVCWLQIRWLNKLFLLLLVHLADTSCYHDNYKICLISLMSKDFREKRKEEEERCVKLQSLIRSHTTRVQWVCSDAENSVIVATVKRLGFISRWGAREVFS